MSAPIGVLGAGIMGRGISRVFAAGGYSIRLADVGLEQVTRGIAILETDLQRARGQGRIEADEAAAIVTSIQPVAHLGDLEDCALVIEAAPEDLALKRSLFAQLDAVLPAQAPLASNTSALSITAIAAATTRPGRVLGLHFFNPVHRMPLVEVVAGLASDPAAVEIARQACEGIGMTTVSVADRPGFVTSRTNVLIGNEAFYMLMEGVASARDIDRALTIGLRHPMGPFELVDLVGLDTRLSVLRDLHQRLGEKFRPCPLMVNYVEAGRLGRKTGRGVYRYDERGRRIEEPDPPERGVAL